MLIAICDDEKHTRDYLCRLVKDHSEEYKVYCFESGKELLAFAKKNEVPDLIFLDIDFNNDMDGMAVAGKLKEKQISAGTASGSLPLIVFVTGIPERMQEAFAVRAFQFLVKPINEKQLLSTLQQAEKEIENIKQRKASDGTKTINIGGKKLRINTDDLIFVESEGRKLKLHINGRTVECYGKMEDAISQMGQSFCLIHRSYLVNLKHVFTYERTHVELADGSIIPMSKYKYKDFLDAFLSYGRRRM